MTVNVVVFLFIWASKVLGQVQHQGQFDGYVRQIYFGKRASASELQDLRIEVPAHDSRKLLLEDEKLKSRQTAGNYSGPLTFAEAIPMMVDSRIHGVWENDTNLGIRSWSLMIASKTALSLSLIFSKYRIDGEGELYVMNDEKELGAYTKQNNKADEKFAIQPVPGSMIFLVYIEKFNAKGAFLENQFRIEKVVHGYRPLFQIEEKDASGSCNVDVRCVGGYTDQRKATVLLMTNHLQKFCSGVMLNDVPGSNRQFLLTARHCVFADLSNSITGFNYERLGCGSGSVSGPQTAHGLKLLSQGSDSDFALFEVVEKIPKSYNVYLAGWDTRIPSLVRLTSVAGLHHPSGDVKKISSFNGILKLASWSEGPRNSYHLMISKWTSGVTEPGSSGSPLFSTGGLVLGQLHGGASACTNLNGADLYGSFSFSFKGNPSSGTSLAPYLDPQRQLSASAGYTVGRFLYAPMPSPGSTVTSIVTQTITKTVTSAASCSNQCIPRDLIEKMLETVDVRLQALEQG